MDEPSSSNDPTEEDPTPIPSVLHSAYLEGPFAECVSCGADLSDTELPYQIQKTWRSGEVVFELAICARCAADSMKEFSEESLEKMQTYFADHFQPAESLDHCHFCRDPVEPGTEFGVGAPCRGPFLLRPPVVICGGCTAASQENLSQKTRDAWGDFIDRTLPGVPRELEPDTVPFAF